jgi:hypothetical protein
MFVIKTALNGMRWLEERKLLVPTALLIATAVAIDILYLDRWSVLYIG